MDVTHSQYQPCRVFPTEVADYYSTVALEPCSALSLLVGPHANHPRLRLVEALEVMPGELMREEVEFRHTVSVFAREVQSQHLKCAEADRAVADEIAEVEAQMEALRRKRGELETRAAELAAARVKDESILHVHSAELRAVALRYLRAISTLKPYYEESFAAGGIIPRHSFECSLQELLKTERQLAQDLEVLASVQIAASSDFAAVAPATFDAIAAAQTTSSGRNGSGAPPSAVPSALNRTPVSPERFNHVPSVFAATIPLAPASFHHQSASRAHGDASLDEIRNSVAAVQQQLAERLAAAGGPRHGGAGASTPPPQPSLSGGGAGLAASTDSFSGGGPAAPLRFSPGRGAADRDALLFHVLSNQEQHIVSSRHHQHHNNSSKNAPPPPPLAAASSDGDDDVLGHVLRAKATNPSSSSSSSGFASDAGRDATNGAGATSTVDLSSYTATGETTTATTTCGTGVTATTVDPRDTTRLAARLLKQFKRVRQCLRDATVGKQHKLARSLVKTIEELRSEARGYHIDDLEAAIGVDAELLDLLR